MIFYFIHIFYDLLVIFNKIKTILIELSYGLTEHQWASKGTDS